MVDMDLGTDRIDVPEAVQVQVAALSQESMVFNSRTLC